MSREPWHQHFQWMNLNITIDLIRNSGFAIVNDTSKMH